MYRSSRRAFRRPLCWRAPADCCAPPISPCSSSACGRAGPGAEFLTWRRQSMDLVADRGRRVSVDELNTTRLLAHARQQAHQRKLDDILIVDVDAHHYENEHMSEILPFMENDVLRQLSIQGRSRNSLMPQVIGYQDMGGRVTRYPLRSSEKTEPGRIRDVQLGERWMDAMSVDYSCLFPTGMLSLGTHPQKEMEVELCWAYSRWITEKVLPDSGGRMY